MSFHAQVMLSVIPSRKPSCVNDRQRLLRLHEARKELPPRPHPGRDHLVDAVALQPVQEREILLRRMVVVVPVHERQARVAQRPDVVIRSLHVRAVAVVRELGEEQHPPPVPVGQARDRAHVVDIHRRGAALAHHGAGAQPPVAQAHLIAADVYGVAVEYLGELLEQVADEVIGGRHRRRVVAGATFQVGQVVELRHAGHTAGVAEGLEGQEQLDAVAPAVLDQVPPLPGVHGPVRPAQRRVALEGEQVLGVEGEHVVLQAGELADQPLVARDRGDLPARRVVLQAAQAEVRPVLDHAGRQLHRAAARTRQVQQGVDAVHQARARCSAHLHPALARHAEPVRLRTVVAGRGRRPAQRQMDGDANRAGAGIVRAGMTGSQQLHRALRVDRCGLRALRPRLQLQYPACRAGQAPDRLRPRDQCQVVAIVHAAAPLLGDPHHSVIPITR